MYENVPADKSKIRLRQIFASLCLFLVVFAVIFAVDAAGILRPRILLDAAYQLVSPEIAGMMVEAIPLPAQVKDHANPINGVLMTKTEYDALMLRSPIAIVTNNFTSARPQYGLSKADTVMEVLAEGGITRYVPIYYQNYDLAKVGPVRSLRYYMIMFTSEYSDAVIFHEGWAGFDNTPVETYRKETDARGAVFAYHIKSMRSGARYRDMAKAKKDGYVHALYTDFGRIQPELDRMTKVAGWKLGSTNLEPVAFKFDEPVASRGDFKSVSINFLNAKSIDFQSGFEYDKASNTYKRSIAGKPDMDLLTNQQIAPKNVIIEWHNYRDANDGHRRIIIDMTGEDKVQVLNDGKVTEGKWKKDCRTCRTKYFTAEGTEIPLVRGQNWIVNAVKSGNRLVSNIKFD